MMTLLKGAVILIVVFFVLALIADYINRGTPKE
jgi:hypothetical protein